MDLFSTTALNGVLRYLPQPSSYLLDRYFKSMSQSTAAEIAYEVILGGRRMAPLCSPVVAGRVIRERGVRLERIAPAYIKDKRQFDPERALRRAVGAQIGGSLTPKARLETAISLTLTDQVNMLVRRLEWMASGATRDAALTLEGEDYPRVRVEFGRHAALDVDLTAQGHTPWSSDAAKPLDDLQRWADLVLYHGGGQATDVIMSVATWLAFKENAQVKDRLKMLATANQTPLDVGAVSGEGGVIKGTVDGFTIIVYAGWYEDETGASHPLWPADELALVAPAALEGTRYFGAIQDLDAIEGEAEFAPEKRLQAVPYFVKSWKSKDPSARFVLMQSAPLIGPRRPNASLRAKVLAPGGIPAGPEAEEP